MITYRFEIQKCGQILCAHKPCFLMPGHIYRTTHTHIRIVVVMYHNQIADIHTYVAKLSVSTIKLFLPILLHIRT